MNKFKIGDRVRVYGHQDCGASPVYTVVVADDFGIAVSLTPNSTRHCVHPKQCRRLKKKKVRYATYVECPKVLNGRHFSVDYYDTPEAAKRDLQNCSECTSSFVMKVIERVR